ncbi:MAG: DinB family protein [Planctomycetota bacterium]
MESPSQTRDPARLRALLARISALFELPEERLRAPAPTVSGWSAAEHLFHVTLANDMSLKNVRNLADERGRLRRELEELDPRAVDILRRGRLPRGTEAPRFVRPPAKPDLAIARDIHGDVLKAAEELEGRAPELAAAPLGIPHQALGVLTAAQWLRFARLHSAHHLGIVRSVLEATG